MTNLLLAGLILGVTGILLKFLAFALSGIWAYYKDSRGKGTELPERLQGLASAGTELKEHYKQIHGRLAEWSIQMKEILPEEMQYVVSRQWSEPHTQYGCGYNVHTTETLHWSQSKGFYGVHKSVREYKGTTSPSIDVVDMKLTDAMYKRLYDHLDDMEQEIKEEVEKRLSVFRSSGALSVVEEQNEDRQDAMDANRNGAEVLPV